VRSSLLFLVGKKDNKRKPPCAAENPLVRWFPWRGQKLALYSGMSGIVLPIPFIETCKYVNSYPLKQFAHVIHGNQRIRAASQ